MAYRYMSAQLNKLSFIFEMDYSTQIALTTAYVATILAQNEGVTEHSTYHLHSFDYDHFSFAALIRLTRTSSCSSWAWRRSFSFCEYEGVKRAMLCFDIIWCIHAPLHIDTKRTWRGSFLIRSFICPSMALISSSFNSEPWRWLRLVAVGRRSQPQSRLSDTSPIWSP